VDITRLRKGITVPKSVQVICKTLLDELHKARNIWLAAAKAALTNTLPGPQPSPHLYSFDTEDGRSVEAEIICWQMLFAIEFAVQNEYLNEQEEDEFRTAWMHFAENDTRLVTSLACLFSENGPTEDSIASALASYLAPDITDSRKIEATGDIIKKGMTLLRLLTFVATATAFGEMNTARELEELVSSQR
jgi:hypothetical protein